MMIELLDSLIKFSLDLIASAGYPGIVAIIALENIFPPIPSEVVMPFAGFLVTQGRFAIVPTIAAGVAGSVLGAVILYAIGSVLRGDRLRRFLDHYGKFIFVSTDDLDHAEQYFVRYGDWAVLIARVIPIVRSLISVPAGFVKMKLLRFVILTTLGTLIWTTVLTLAGVILGANWGLIGPVLKKYEHVILFLIVGAGVVFLYHKIKNRKNASNLTPNPNPRLP